MTAPVSRERTTLNRDLAEVVLALSGACQRFQMYPDGHPARHTAVDTLVRRLDILFLARPSVAIGVTPTQLLVGGMATDPSHAVLRELAGQLHGRGLGAVKLLRGAGARDLEAMLDTVTTHGFVLQQQASHGPCIRLYPLAYENLALVEEEDPGEEELRNTWAESVWLGLAKVALGDYLPEELAIAANPVELAVAIEIHSSDPEFDRGILRALRDAMRLCRDRGRAESVAVQQHLDRLIAALPAATLRRLFAMADDQTVPRELLLDATHVLSAEVVLRLATAAARAAQRSLSPGLLQLLGKLSVHAESGPPARRTRADQALRDQLRQVLMRWDQEDTSVTGVPEDYQAMLARLPRRSSGGFDLTRAYAAEPERIIQMSLESGIIEPGTVRAVDQMIVRRQVVPLLDLLETVPKDDAVGSELRGRVIHPYTVQVLVGAAPIDVEALARVIPDCGIAAAPAVLDALANAKERRVRARLLDLLGRFGAPLGPELLARIPGAPWYVQRNLLKLLGMLPELPPEFSPSACLAHADARVRHEGLKILLADPANRDEALELALRASDEPTLRLGLTAAAERCPHELGLELVARLRRGDLIQPLRPLALRAVARIEDRSVLELLLSVAFPRRWLGLRRLAPKSPEVLNALQGLAVHWRGYQAAAVLVERATRSRDREVREAAGYRPPPALPRVGPKVVM